VPKLSTPDALQTARSAHLLTMRSAASCLHSRLLRRKMLTQETTTTQKGPLLRAATLVTSGICAGLLDVMVCAT